MSRKPARRLGQHDGDEEPAATDDDGASRDAGGPTRHAPSSRNDCAVAWQLKPLEDPA